MMRLPPHWAHGALHLPGPGPHPPRRHGEGAAPLGEAGLVAVAELGPAAAEPSDAPLRGPSRHGPPHLGHALPPPLRADGALPPDPRPPRHPLGRAHGTHLAPARQDRPPRGDARKPRPPRLPP